MDGWLEAVFDWRCKLFILSGINEEDKQGRKKLINFITENLNNPITPQHNASRSEIYVDCMELTWVYEVNQREKYNIRITGIPDNKNDRRIIPLFFDIFSRSYDDFYLSESFQKTDSFSFRCPEESAHECSVTIKTRGNDFLPMRFPAKNQAMLAVFCKECGYEKDEKTIRTDTINTLGIETHRSKELRKKEAMRREELFTPKKL